LKNSLFQLPTFHSLRYLVDQGCLRPLCNLLDCMDPKVIIVALDALENILKVGKQIEANTGENTFGYFIDFLFFFFFSFFQ